MLVGIGGIEGMEIAGMDQAFKPVELPSGLLAFPGEVKKLEGFGKVFLRVSPEMVQVELNLRDKLDAADTKIVASCAEM